MQPIRRRWDRPPRQKAPYGSGQAKPPFPAHLSDAIWIVSRLDPALIAPLLPPGLTPTAEMIGVLAIFEVPSGSALSPFARAFGGVTVQGHQAPDSKDAVYVIADLVTDNAVHAWRDNYIDTCLTGEPRVWWEGDVLHGAVASEGREWLHAVVKVIGPAQNNITGQDAYLSRVSAGVARHIVSYHGALLPCEVVSLDIADDAPAPFAALRPKELILGISAHDLHATWSEAQPVSQADTRPAPSGDARDPASLLRSIGLTPAEAPLLQAFRNGSMDDRELVAVAKLGVGATAQRESLRVRQQEVETGQGLLASLFGLAAGILSEGDVPDVEVIDVTPVEDLHAEVQAERQALIRLQASPTGRAG